MSVDVYADGRVQLMHSPIAMHSGPIALNLLHNALLRYHCGSDCWIELTSRPLVNPQQVKVSQIKIINKNIVLAVKAE